MKPSPPPEQGKIAGIDFGTVRIGVAMCDAERLVAFPFEIWRRKTEQLDLRHFQEFVKNERIVHFVVGLPLHCSGEMSDKARQATEFAEKLADLEYVEKLQGVTMAGPHRDDLALCASGYEMRSVGSQGQCRSAAIAMRFAAVDVASQHVGKPILLLDDIFAELDVNRRDAVAALVRDKDSFTADKEIPLGA